MTYLSDSYVNDSQEIPLNVSLLDTGTYPSENPPPDWDLNDGLTWTGVMDALDKAPQSHAEGRTGEPAAPVWAIAMIFAGLVLMAIGWLLNDPITQLIYGAIHAK